MTRSLATLLALLWPGLAMAASDDAAGPNWTLLGLQVFNTVVLLFILIRYAGRPVRNFLFQRSHDIRSQIESAEQRLREAQEELARLQARLEAFGDEADEIMAQSVERAEGERDRVLERANANSDRMQEEARRVADHEIERARQELRAEASELATSIARELLRENLSSEDDRRLTREYIEQVGRAGGEQ